MSVASACEMAIKMANWPIVVVAVRESTIRAGLQASFFPLSKKRSTSLALPSLLGVCLLTSLLAVSLTLVYLFSRYVTHLEAEEA